MEQGPTTAMSRSSMPCRMRWMACRASCTAVAAPSLQGNSRMRWAGGASSLMAWILRSSVAKAMRPFRKSEGGMYPTPRTSGISSKSSGNRTSVPPTGRPRSGRLCRERLDAGLGAAEDQGVHVVGAFVRVHRLEVHHVPDDVELVGDAVAA